MNLNQIEKLSDNKLISEYKIIRERFLKIKPFESAEEEIARVYGLIIREVRKRSLESLTMYM
jgi:hypothetical protein